MKYPAINQSSPSFRYIQKIILILIKSTYSASNWFGVMTSASGINSSLYMGIKHSGTYYEH